MYFQKEFRARSISNFSISSICYFPAYSALFRRSLFLGSGPSVLPTYQSRTLTKAGTRRHSTKAGTGPQLYTAINCQAFPDTNTDTNKDTNTDTNIVTNTAGGLQPQLWSDFAFASICPPASMARNWVSMEAWERARGREQNLIFSYLPKLLLSD